MTWTVPLSYVDGDDDAEAQIEHYRSQDYSERTTERMAWLMENDAFRGYSFERVPGKIHQFLISAVVKDAETASLCMLCTDTDTVVYQGYDVAYRRHADELLRLWLAQMMAKNTP